VTLPSWRPGTAVQGPVYLDANIWVSALVNSQPRYKSASRLLADLIAAGVPLVVSDIVASESHWALARLAYAELIHQRSDRVNWHRAA
jgi:predicted nucleic acid-binding protein